MIWENIKQSFSALRMNKMRAFLTMLGIIIGIGSVIAIMTVSESLTASISSSFEDMGANNITVGLKQISEENETRDGMVFGLSNRNVSMDEEDLITDEMLDDMRQTFGSQISAVALSESVGSGTVVNDNTTANISMTGINEDYYDANEINLVAGRYIKEADLTGEKAVVMISDLAAKNLFGERYESALWEPVNIQLDNVYYQYYIVGVYEYSESEEFSSSTSEDVTTSAYIPLTTAKKQQHSDDGYSQFTLVTSGEVSSASDFANRVENFFAQYYRENEDYEISTTTMETLTESMNEMIESVSIAIAFIAAISLLVGGIGVMNIMLVSITERTREIGVRKALGAKNGYIRLQFITESVVLCLVGGVLGILLGVGLGSVAAGILGYAATPPVGAIFIAVGFSMMIGVFFGYYPANKAAKLNPIDALRYE